MSSELGGGDANPSGSGPPPAAYWPGSPMDGDAGGIGAGEGLPEGWADDTAPVSTPMQRVLRAVLEWLFIIVCALALALLLKTFLVQAFSIPSRSMEPTLTVGDRVLVYKLGYRLHDINRGDVVVFRKQDESVDTEELIKRVVAVGGDTLELRDGRVYIDAEMLDEPYLEHFDSTFPKAPIPGCVNEAVPDRCEVPEGQILVFGDNREHSRDGRFFGPVDEDDVVGRAFMKYWPPSDLGSL